MHKEKNIFKYKYEEKIAYVLDILQKAGIDYIEISPIVPQNSEIWFEKKVVLKNKLYSMAVFSANFNLINIYLEKNKDYFTSIKCLNEGKEVDLIFIQIHNKDRLIKIKELIKNYEYKYKQEEKYTKIVIKI